MFKMIKYLYIIAHNQNNSFANQNNSKARETITPTHWLKSPKMVKDQQQCVKRKP